jgi:drug/metabolite transporter (DMT)-like permease
MSGSSGVVDPRPLLGVSAMLINTLLIPIMGLAIKRLAVDDVGTLEMLAWRSLLVMVVLLPLLGYRNHLREILSADLKAHLVHALVSVTVMACFYYALRTMPIVTVTAINFTTPIFALLFARMIFGERVSALGWTAMAVGFAGTLLVLRPDGSGIGLDAAVVLFGSFLAGISNLLVRRMPARSSNFAVVFYLSAAGALVYGILGVPSMQMPEPHHWVWLATLAGVAVSIHTFVTLAFRFAASMLVGALDYLRIIWAFFVGWFFVGEMPVLLDWLGIAMIVASGALVLRASARPATGGPAA